VQLLDLNRALLYYLSGGSHLLERVGGKRWENEGKWLAWSCGFLGGLGCCLGMQ
jgi:hypothetical protein